MFEKLEKDGKIAVVYSPGFGAGWSSWHIGDAEGLLFDREIAEAVLSGDRGEAVEIAQRKYGSTCWDGGRSLDVAWVPKGARFEISEYDGAESVRVFGPDEGHVA